MENNRFKPEFNSQSDLDFSRELRKRVDAYLKSEESNGKCNLTMIFKSLFYVITLLSIYTAILQRENTFILEIGLYILFGLCSAFMVMNVAHDASHGAYSASVRVNNILSLTWNLFGLSGYMWKLKHNSSHHLYTNIIGFDHDISQSGLLRLNPEQPFRKIYRYQHIYAIPLYSLLSLFIVFYKDFAMFSQKEFGSNTVRNHPPKEWMVMIVSKLFYCSYLILIPWLNSAMTFAQIITCFLAMHGCIGLVIALILTPPHINDQTYFVSTSKGYDISKNWQRHQIETTLDYAATSRVAAFICGGLNTHVAHHLFPGICHIHYRNISKIIRKTASEFGIKYRNMSYPEILKAHLGYLKKSGMPSTEQNIKYALESH